MKTKRKVKFVLAAVLLFTSVLFVLRSNWIIHARFELLLSGHPLAKLVEPAQVVVFPEGLPSGLEITKLAYSHGQFIGYVDNSACFVGVSTNGSPLLSSEALLQSSTRREAMLFWLQVASGLSALFLLIRIISRKCHELSSGSARHS